MQYWITLLLFILVLIVVTNSQAPDDADSECVDISRYERNQRRLMDSWDYVRLLPQPSDINATGGVWQELNVNNDNQGTWTSASGVSCKEEVSACGGEGDTQNWLITQFIPVLSHVKSVKVMIVSSSPTNRTSAEVSLYVWETSTQSKILSTATSKYRYIADVSIGQTVIELPPLTQSGLYLGIRDNGTCIVISRVLVYYLAVCEAGRQGLVRMEGNSSAGDTLPGTCVENSVSTSGSGPPTLQCLESGQWRVNCPQGNTRCRALGPCECRPGYQQQRMNEDMVCSACPVGMFSEGSGGQCRQCPANTNSTQPGMGVCPCLIGFYRPSGSVFSADCIKAPIDEATDNTGLDIGSIIGAAFGSFCALLLIAISFIFGLILGRYLQKQKTSSHYDVIPAYSGSATAKKNTKSRSGWTSSSRSPSQTRYIHPPPLPGERSTRSSREDMRGSTANVSTDGRVATPEYAVLEGPTPPIGHHNGTLGNGGVITNGKRTTRVSQTEPEYAVPSPTSEVGRHLNGVRKHQNNTEGSASSHKSENGPPHQYAVLEDPALLENSATTSPNSNKSPAVESLDDSPQVPDPVVKIVVHDESGTLEETQMEATSSPTH